MNILCKFLRNLSKRTKPMATVDFTALNAELDNLAINVQKVAEALGATSGSAATIAQLQADLAAAQADTAAKQADLDASQAAVADLTAKAKSSDDVLAGLVTAA